MEGISHKQNPDAIVPYDKRARKKQLPSAPNGFNNSNFTLHSVKPSPSEYTGILSSASTGNHGVEKETFNKSENSFSRMQSHQGSRVSSQNDSLDDISDIHYGNGNEQYYINQNSSSSIAGQKYTKKKN